MYAVDFLVMLLGRPVNDVEFLDFVLAEASDGTLGRRGVPAIVCMVYHVRQVSAAQRLGRRVDPGRLPSSEPPCRRS